MAGDKKPPRRQRADSVDSVLSDLQSARRKVLGKKEIPPDHEALVRNNEKLQKELLEVRAANRKLEKEKEDLNIECNELSEEKGERDGNTKGYKEEVLDLKVKLQAARETAGEDRARAERAEKELDEIWSSIAHKRREAEERIVISKADREELEERRRVWNHPGTQALLSGRAEIARHWENNEEKEKQMVMDFVKSRQNARTPKSNMKTWKKPSPDDANDNEAIMEKLQQRLAERENEFAALEAKFEKVNNAEREPNTDDAVSDLRPQLDEAHEKIETLEKEIKTLEKEISASNQAREEASAAMERLKKKIRKVGKWPGQGSAFSMPVSGSTSSEQGGVSSEAGTNSEATAHSLAEELARCEDGPDDNVSLVSWRGDYSSGEEDDQVLETDRPREAARIRDLEELVVSQLEFHRDVEPHLALTRDQFMEFRAFHADIFKKLGVSDEAEPEVEAVKVEASRAAVDDAKEVIRQVLGRVVGARGEKMRGNWVPMQKANMRLRLVVGEAREVLKENALRLGIKVRAPILTPTTSCHAMSRLTGHRSPSPIQPG